MNDLKIESQFNRNKTIEIINLYLKEGRKSNFELSLTNETYYIKKKKSSSYNQRMSLDFFMLQFTVKETPNSTILIMTPQSGMVSLLTKILILPLIWIFILVFLFNKDYSHLSTPFMISGGIAITFLLLLIERKNKRFESNIINDLRNKLEVITHIQNNQTATIN